MNCKEALRLIIKKGWLKPITLDVSITSTCTKANTKEENEIAKLVAFLVEFNKGRESTPYCDCKEALRLLFKFNLFKEMVVTTTDSLEDVELTNFLREFRNNVDLKDSVKLNSKDITFYTIKEKPNLNYSFKDMKDKNVAKNGFNWIADEEEFELRKDLLGLTSIKGRTIPKIRHINVGERKGKKLVCVVFEDGSHIIKECHPEDEFDINVGVALCLAEKYYSTTNQFHKLVKRKLAEKSKETLENWKKANKKDPE